MRSDPAPYRCKLAEAIHLAVTDALRYDSSTPSTPLDLSVPILAVLASEGVVDPAFLQMYVLAEREVKQLRAEVMRLEAAMNRWLKEYDHPMPSYFRDALRSTGDSDD